MVVVVILPFSHIEGVFLVTAGEWGRGVTFNQAAAPCSIMVMIFQSWWIIPAVFRKANVSYFWDAIDSVQEPFGTQMIANWQCVHPGLHVGVIYHLASWALLHARHNYKAIKSSSMGRRLITLWTGRENENRISAVYYMLLCALLFYPFFSTALGSKCDFLCLVDKVEAQQDWGCGLSQATPPN